MKWSLSKVYINLLQEYAKNPRVISKTQHDHLVKSLKTFGLCEPIVCNTDYTIIGGHQRVRALREMGETEVEVYTPDRPLSDKELSELCIRLNRNTGAWSYDMLANDYELDDLIDYGFTLNDFDICKDDKELSNETSDKTPQKKAKITITFASVEDLQAAENRISTVVDEFTGASYKSSIPK